MIDTLSIMDLNVCGLYFLTSHWCVSYSMTILIFVSNPVSKKFLFEKKIKKKSQQKKLLL